MYSSTVHTFSLLGIVNNNTLTVFTVYSSTAHTFFLLSVVINNTHILFTGCIYQQYTLSLLCRPTHQQYTHSLYWVYLSRIHSLSLLCVFIIEVYIVRIPNTETYWRYVSIYSKKPTPSDSLKDM